MGDTIGRYQIRRELGRGAQSVVYLAFDPQLEREVAIKTLHFARPDRERNRALLEEARIVSRLKHPRIVPIYDAGSEAGDIYLVFEYVAGQSLAASLKRQGAWPVAKAMGLMLAVLDAVAHAHEHGVIHRDLKPSNILLDAAGDARVMDFGIATRAAGSAAAGEERLGTPAYMAPEYLATGRVTPQGDVFAAGLVLYELVYGRPAVNGRDVRQIVHQIANLDIALPKTTVPGFDARAVAIVTRALARDPARRFASAADMATAIRQFLEPPATETLPAEGGSAAPSKGTVEFLLRRMRHHSDFPALSESVSAVNRIANSEYEHVHQLSDSILRDFGLTNKLLRLVNSAYYRQAGAGAISTVSRAIIVLGFDAVRNIAVSVLLFEHLESHNKAAQLKDEFLRAHLAGVLARELAGTNGLRDPEEAFVCALFRDLGRLLSRYYFPEEFEEIVKLVQHRKLSPAAASGQVLGVPFEELGLAIAGHWGLPTRILDSMRELPAGTVPRPTTAEGELRATAAYSHELCEVLLEAAPDARSRELRKLRTRFAACADLGESELAALIDRAVTEIMQVARALNLDSRSWRQLAEAVSVSPEEGPAATSEDDDALRTMRLDASTTTDGAEQALATDEAPPSAQAILMSGIEDITQALVEDFSLNDLLRIILETMYRAIGFQRVILCIRDAATNAMVGRFGFGPDAQEMARRLRFPLAYAPDVFHLATSKGVDLMINDIDDPGIRGRIPDWFRRGIPAATFLLFPLMIKGSAVALIYADRAEAGSINVEEKELALLRTLRNQAVLALKQRT